jgi:primosomal protein N' (replication factor Y) (superfamily II helicase)
MSEASEQLSLVGGRRSRKVPLQQDSASGSAIARLLVDTALAHLDRPFDYSVPAALDDAVVAGVRVRVRFAGARRDAWVLERVTSTDHPGRLASIDRVVSPVPALTAELQMLCRAVADRWAGSMSDVVRSAIPARHARAEAQAELDKAPAPVVAGESSPGMWEQYDQGDRILDASSRLVAAVAPGDSSHELVAIALATAPRGALAVVPDHRDVTRVMTHLQQLTDPEHVVVLTADVGPAERYRRWLRVLRGQARIVVGTRAATFAPVCDLVRVVILDDGDDLHAEPHAPYWHAREVLALRAHQQGAGFVAIAHARTAEAQQLVNSGWAHSVERPRGDIRTRSPRIIGTGSDEALAGDVAARSARIPRLAFDILRSGLARGPVLVSSARGGYVPRLSCQDCRTALQCPVCHGALAMWSSRVPSCTRCGRLCGDVRCISCGSTRRRADSVGSMRTAEELGRAFPGIPVRTSGGDHVLHEVDSEPALVICTPGAEPFATEGFAAAVILDARVGLDRPDLRAGEETLRRWFDVAARVRPASVGGEVAVVAEADLPSVQALIRWDPVGAAGRELHEREQMRMTPAARTAEIVGSAVDVSEFLAALDVPGHAQVLGPVAVAGEQERVRMYVSVPRAEGQQLSAALKAVQAGRSARKEGAHVVVRVDPVVIG